MSEKSEIHIPNLGGINDVEILEIFVEPGDKVAKEDPLLSLETDKAVMEVPCPADGVLDSFTVDVGDTISEGDLIGYLQKEEGESEAEEVKKEPEKPKEEKKEKPEEQSKPEVKKEKVEQKKLSAPASSPSPSSATNSEPSPSLDLNGRFHASPSVRKFGRELGADLTQVSGSGPNGRITKEDVQKWIKNQLQSPSAGSSTSSLPPVKPEDFRKYGEVDEEKLNKIKQITGSRLQASWQNIPHVTHFDEADVTELENFRKELNQQLEKEGIKITPLAFIIKAAVKALKEYPRFNSSISDQGDLLFLKKYYNIGFAADTPDGLMVPVIQNADQKGVRDIARELMETSSKARDKKLDPGKLTGSSFTISSLGSIGGTQFTPVINPPDAAIMGVSRSKWSPQWNGKEFVPRLILPFSLSYDHRIIDGAEAARFCRLVAEILTDFRLSAI